MPKPLPTCPGTYTRDDVDESLQSATTIEDFKYWALALSAWPGTVVGFGVDEKDAGADATKKAHAAASDFCHVLKGCSSAAKCEWGDITTVVIDTYRPLSEGGDWSVVLKVKTVACKCVVVPKAPPATGTTAPKAE